MKKKQKKLRKKQQQKPTVQPIDFLFGLIIAAYIFIPTFTPNWMSLDTNTPKFFMTALLNLIVFAVIYFNGYSKNNFNFFKAFYFTNIGLIYSAFLIVSLLSFSQAVNLLESILQFTKIFTVFAAVFNLSVILKHDLRFVKLIAITVTGILFFDSISVFYYISKFINGEIATITDIKTVYSNKNILASAIFVKLVFALWLMVFEKGWIKIIGFIGFGFGVAATFFMATRTFYLGLLILYLVFVGYNIAIYFRYKQKRALWLTASSIGAILIAFFVFTFVQQNLYPEHRSRHTQSILKQLATLKNPATASKNRTDAWRWSIELIKEKPLLGVGSGNWKVNILKYENQQNPGFIYLYKAHNDFLETTAETGIIGGMFFLGIFVVLLINFIRHYRHKDEDHEHLLQYFFLAAAGVGFYSVDAFFNFPADRPEILALFIIFVATGIASVDHRNALAKEKNTIINNDSYLNKKPVKIAVGLFSFALLGASAWILYINFQSSKTQRIIYQEILAGELKEPSSRIIAGLPFIPNVSVWGEPVGALKARYLIQEEKFEEAIDVLRPDHTSPWDARREFFMAMAFNNLKEYDSALHYSQIAHELKPNYFRNLHLVATLLERKEDYNQASLLYNNYLQNNKKDDQAWLAASNLHIQNKNYEKANAIITEASRYIRHNKNLDQQKEFLHHKLNVEPHLDLFAKASDHYQAKRFNKTVEVLNEFLEKVPDYVNGLQIRAFAHYYLNNYDACIKDANKALKLDKSNSSLVNLRGVCYRALDDLDKACKDFNKSMQMGNESGKTNYERFCSE
jgi:putative inorganic carbon (hco3(-)) transporter